jgi:hypothetical protein
MVLFILTREGYEDVRSLVSTSAVWINRSVLSEAEIAELRSSGVDLSCFTEPIDGLNESEMQYAIDTIAEHHPGQRIWVETHRKSPW